MTQSQPEPSGILKSNVDDISAEPRQQVERRGVLVPLLPAGLVAGLTVAAAALFIARPSPRATPVVPTTRVVVAATPLAPAVRANDPGAAKLPAVNGISCDALESMLFHIHLHLAIFANGQV